MSPLRRRHPYLEPDEPVSARTTFFQFTRGLFAHSRQVVEAPRLSTAHTHVPARPRQHTALFVYNGYRVSFDPWFHALPPYRRKRYSIRCFEPQAAFFVPIKFATDPRHWATTFRFLLREEHLRFGCHRRFPGISHLSLCATCCQREGCEHHDEHAHKPTKHCSLKPRRFGLRRRENGFQDRSHRTSERIYRR